MRLLFELIVMVICAANRDQLWKEEAGREKRRLIVTAPGEVTGAVTELKLHLRSDAY